MSDTDTTDETTAVENAVVELPEDSVVVDTPTTDTEDADEDQAEEADTFPRSYVERLRRESAGYRERANTADTSAPAA